MPEERQDSIGLPPGAFIDPAESNRSLVEHLMHRVLDVVLGLSSSASDRPLLATKQLDLTGIGLHGRPASEEDLVRELSALLNASANLAHPGSIAHRDAPPTTASILGSLAAAGVNNNLLFEELSPAFTALEHRLLQEIAGLFGLGSEAGGIMLPGGSLANLQALAVAREHLLKSLGPFAFRPPVARQAVAPDRGTESVQRRGHTGSADRRNRGVLPMMIAHSEFHGAVRPPRCGLPAPAAPAYRMSETGSSASHARDGIPTSPRSAPAKGGGAMAQAGIPPSVAPRPRAGSATWQASWRSPTAGHSRPHPACGRRSVRDALAPRPGRPDITATAAVNRATVLTADERILNWSGPVRHRDARR